MGRFKDDFYKLLIYEIAEYQPDRDKKEPFLYSYLKKKKEDNPRLVIRRAYYEYNQNKLLNSEQVFNAALQLVKREKTLQNIKNKGSFVISIINDEEKFRKLKEESDTNELCCKIVSEILSLFPYNEKRNDKYVVLREKQLMLNSGEFENKLEYFSFLLSIATSGKYYIDDKCFELFCDIWSDIRKNNSDLPEITVQKNNKNNLKIIGDTFKLSDKSINNAHALSLKKLNALTELLLAKIIRNDAEAWLYDSGYSVNEKSRNISMPRKTDSTMDLLDDFFTRPGMSYEFNNSVQQSSNFVSTELTEKKKQEIQTLFGLLDSDKNRRTVIIPLFIDSLTGDGLYIAGNDYINDNSNVRDYRKKHNCCYSMVELYDTNIDKSLLMNSVAFDFDEVYFDNLDEAYKAYMAHISIENYLRFTFYCDQNKKKPLGCPRSFLNYFDCEDDDCDIEQLKKAESLELSQIKTGELPAISSSKIRF